MMIRAASFLPAFLFMVALGEPTDVVAQSSKRKAAQLVEEAVALVEAGETGRAIESLDEAYTLDPAPVILGHMARAYERRGELTKARELYERWISAEKDPGRLAKAKEWLSNVLDRIPGRLVVTTEPPGGLVQVDGVSVAEGKPVGMRRGRHVVTVRQDGYTTETRVADVQAGEDTHLEIRLATVRGRIDVRSEVSGARVMFDGGEPQPLPLERPVEVVVGQHRVRVEADGFRPWEQVVEVAPDGLVVVNVPVADLDQTKNLGERGISPWQWVAIGTGGAVLAVGAVMSGMAYYERELVRDASREGNFVTGMSMAAAAAHMDKARNYDTASYVMYGLGGAAVVTGIVLAVTRPKANGKDGRRHAVGASPLPGGMSLMFSAAF